MGLTLEDLDEDWVAGLCRDLARARGEAGDVTVRGFALSELGGAQGVLSRYERSTREAIVGHRLLAIRATAGGRDVEHRLVIKSKAPGAAVRRRLEEVYRRFDPRLAELQHRLSPSILDDIHTRELRIYALELPALRAITPAIHRVWMDPPAQIFAIVMEHLEGVRHARTLDDLDVWQPADIECAVAQLARLHGELLGTISPAAPPPYLVPFDRLNDARLLEYEAALLAYNAATFPDLLGGARARRLEALLAAAPARHRRIMARPLTLIHGDFTPRNVCLRVAAPASLADPADPAGPAGPAALRLCAYDWELAQVHLPQRDLCEFLCYVLPPQHGFRHELAAHLIEAHRAALAAAAGRPIPADEHRHDLALALAELCTFKLLVQGITHQLLGNRYYFERIVHNALDGIAAFAGAAD